MPSPVEYTEVIAAVPLQEAQLHHQEAQLHRQEPGCSLPSGHRPPSAALSPCHPPPWPARNVAVGWRHNLPCLRCKSVTTNPPRQEAQLHQEEEAQLYRQSRLGRRQKRGSRVGLDYHRLQEAQLHRQEVYSQEEEAWCGPTSSVDSVRAPLA